MQANLLQTAAAVLRRGSHTDGACFPGKNRNSSLTGHTNGVVALIGEKSIHWLLPPEGPNSVRVTFRRRRSPQCTPLDLRNQVQSREKRAWNSSRRSRAEWKPITHLPVTPTEWFSSERRAFAGSSIPEGPNSVRVTFSRRSPKCKALDLRNQVQSREKRAWNSSRRSHVRSCNFFANTESSARNLE